jgi:hypothetical protein
MSLDDVNVGDRGAVLRPAILPYFLRCGPVVAGARSRKLPARSHEAAASARSISGQRSTPRACGAADRGIARVVGSTDPAELHDMRTDFSSFEAGRRAARVPVSKRRTAEMSERRAAAAGWSKRRVIGELRRLDRSGASTRWADLMQAGHGALIAAAAVYAGGLQRARAAAGVGPPVRRSPVPRWDHEVIVAAIQARARKRLTLASSKAPQSLVAAARWHFQSWEAALAASGVASQAVRLRRRAYTRPEIIALVRELAREGRAVRPSMVTGAVKLETVRKLFGSVGAAIRAAGVTVVAEHGNQRWSRERVIEELQARAQRGMSTLPGALHRAARLHFGGVPAAREAAGATALLRAPWTAESLVEELRRRARRGDSGRTLWAACKRLFGSVAAARRAAAVPATQRTKGMVAWSKAELLVELQRRTRKRLQLSRGLSAGLRLQFGSLAAARAAARVPARGAGARPRPGAAERGSASRTQNSAALRPPVASRRAAWQRWTRAQVIEKLRAESTLGRPPRQPLQLACHHHFGSLDKAYAAANVSRHGSPWTPARIRRALREPRFDVANPVFVAACIEHFGSVTAARAEAARGLRQRTWSKATLIAELQARARRRLTGVGRLLRDPAIRLFGSTDAALQAAARAPLEPRGTVRRVGSRSP